MGNCNCKQGTNGSQHVCTECDILQLARNNYFTGKLLVERDFTDEQRYTMGKLRRHNQKLHGWGTVCGLKVKQHPIQACRSQYVVIEPGTAIDCCGREILLNCEEYFDFAAKFLANWQAQNPNQQPSGSYKLQICISYKECATEKVPALFDDCANGGGACQPNRILESHSFDVIIDGPSTQTDPAGVSLDWDFTEYIANSVKVAEDDASGRLYVLSSAPGSATTSATVTLYVFNTSNYSLLTPITIANSLGLDVAVSGEGDLIYVAVQPTTSGTNTPTGLPQLYVYNTTTSPTALTPVGSALQITNPATAPDTSVRIAVCPGTEGSIFTFGAQTGVLAWSGLNTSSPPAPTLVTAITAAPVAMVVSGDNQYAYVAVSGSTSNSIIALTMSASPLSVGATIPLSNAGTGAPTSLAIASTTAGFTLAALDPTAQLLYFVDIPTAGPGSPGVTTYTATGFAYPATQVLLSPGGRWAYVLEQDSSGNDYVQSIDEHAVENPGTNFMGAAIAVGVGTANETLSQDGTHLFVPFQGSSSTSGGVALVDVIQQNCGDIFQNVIDCCPDCTEGNCLILATINGYVYQSAVTDAPVGGPIAADEIDNLTDRRLLVSTDVLACAVQCLIDQGIEGTKGATGATGATGPGIDHVSVTFVPCSEAITAGGSLVPEASGNYKLDLTIPGCCNNSLTGIAGVSWSGNGATISLADLSGGMGIAFSGGVYPQDLTNDSVVLLCTYAFDPSGQFITPINEVELNVTAGNFTPLGNATMANFTPASPPQAISNAQITSATAAQVTVASNAGLAAGANAVVAGITNAQFAQLNGTWQVASLSGTTLVNLTTSGLTVAPSTALVAGTITSTVNGLTFATTDPDFQLPNNANFLVLVKGDFIRDANGNAVDGNHLPPWLPYPNSGHTGDGIAGGTFESWMSLQETGTSETAKLKAKGKK